MNDEKLFQQFISNVDPEDWPSWLQCGLLPFYADMPRYTWWLEMKKKSRDEKQSLKRIMWVDIDEDQYEVTKLAKTWFVLNLPNPIPPSFQPSDYKEVWRKKIFEHEMSMTRIAEYVNLGEKLSYEFGAPPAGFLKPMFIDIINGLFGFEYDRNIDFDAWSLLMSLARVHFKTRVIQDWEE